MSTYTAKRKKHAVHNGTVAKYLIDKATSDGVECDDWIVTILFYTAYHHLLGKIFPLVVTSKGSSTTYDDFYAAFKNRKEKQTRRYEYATTLVREKVPPALSDFKILKDKSWGLRYTDYSISTGELESCKKAADNIETICNLP